MSSTKPVLQLTTQHSLVPCSDGWFSMSLAIDEHPLFSPSRVHALMYMSTHFLFVYCLSLSC
eukprot:m.26196 g.26196  ORF g.26196 m.26196 type:complete len:62 (-) comp8802_c0_seq3:1822-2007(-)